MYYNRESTSGRSTSHLITKEEGKYIQSQSTEGKKWLKSYSIQPSKSNSEKPRVVDVKTDKLNSRKNVELIPIEPHSSLLPIRGRNTEDTYLNTNNLSSNKLGVSYTKATKIKRKRKSLCWICMKSMFPNGNKTIVFPIENLERPLDSDKEDDIRYLEENDMRIKAALQSLNPALNNMRQVNNIKFTIERADRKERMLFFKFSETAVKFNCIKDAFNRAGFKRTSKQQFNVIWTKQLKSFEEYRTLNEYQKINHFPGSACLGRKDSLYRSISSMRRKYGEEFSFLPKCWIWSDEKQEITNEFKKNEAISNDKQRWIENLYIVKPRAASCGRGIHIISDLSQIKLKDCIVQKYIANPLLIDGKKFDLRIYVAVTSFDPLRIYVFEEGLVRFATQKYSLSKRSITKNRLAHLTNYSLNKHSEEFEIPSNEIGGNVGSKWSLSALKQYFKAHQIDFMVIWEQIEDIIVKTIISVELRITSLCQAYVRHENICYELFGFDILIDDTLRPWLMEVNTSPSLSSSSPLDKRIKGHLVTCLFNIIGIVPYSRKEYKLKEENERKNKQFLKQEKNEKKTRKTVKELLSIPSKNLINHLSEKDRKIIEYMEDEERRSGSFIRIFPTKTSQIRYSRFMEPRYNNILVSKWIEARN